MSRILLVDDSPHAQRMGERILSEEGFEVVTVSNADSALIRMEDVDPDVVVADTVMPGRTGYDICQFVKMSPRHRHVRVVLTAGVLEPLDEERVKQVEADATLQKPFEASLLIGAVRALAERAREERSHPGAAPGAKAPPATKSAALPFATVVDAGQVRAAVTVALDASMESMVDEITERVLAALHPHKASASATGKMDDELEARPVLRLPSAMPRLYRPSVSTATFPSIPPKVSAPPAPEVPAAAPATPPLPAQPAVSPAASAPPAIPAPTVEAPPRMESVRRVNILRPRPGSILGLDWSYEPEVPAAPHSPAPDPAFPNARPAADPDPAPGSKSSSPTSAVPDKK